jgi:hypothetical protein
MLRKHLEKEGIQKLPTEAFTILRSLGKRRNLIAKNQS